MKNIRKKASKVQIIRLFSTPKITVVCLLLLFILTFWGTIAQIDNGLYVAQERFFDSLYFLALGFVPFPGARFILWVLFINLMCATLLRFNFKFSNCGILIIHLGLLTYFVAAFVTFHGVVESNVSLFEGEVRNLSTSYQKWEISVSKSVDNGRKVTALDVNRSLVNKSFRLEDVEIDILVKEYYTNSNAFSKSSGVQTAINDSGIVSIARKAQDKEAERNIAGGLFKFSKNNQVYDVYLYGGEVSPTKLKFNDEIFYVQLRRRKYPLPFLLKLKDFKMEVHPNTEIAKSYQSLVEIQNQNVVREVLISMNEPLRFKDFTLYQASYAIDELGREMSTLAVVKNAGRILPYVASLLTFFGLFLHFILGAFDLKYQGKMLK